MSFQAQHVEHTPGSLLTLDEAAQRMSVDVHTVEEMVQNNQFPVHQIDGEARVDVAQVDLWTNTQIKRTAALGSNEKAPSNETGT